QLGALGLLKRLRWRLAMAGRIAAFYVAARPRAARFAKAALAAQSKARPTFLPDLHAVGQRLQHSPQFDATSRRRIDKQCVEVLINQVTLRGLGTVSLKFAERNWYAYDATSAIVINRHDFVIPLVQDALLNGNPRTHAKLNELFAYWIDNFDLAQLISRDTPIDTAIRLINWVWVFDSGLLDLTESRRQALLRSVALQIEYVRAWQSAGGNHLVLEALCGYIVGSRYAELRDASRWRGWGRTVLLRELMRQSTTDGVHTEQSMFYHQAVSSHFLKLFLTARACRDELPNDVQERFQRMLEYVHDTAKCNGTHPVVGDGELLTSDDREHWESRALIPARWVLFGKPIHAGFTEHVGDATIWLLGVPENELEFEDAGPTSKVFKDTGLAVLRHGSRSVFFDAAPFSDPEFPHHGHADALNLDVNVGQADLFADPGGYGYYDDDYRRYFRSTAAHNTITIDGKNQSELFGVLGYGRLAQASILDSRLGPAMDFVRGTHNGYAPTRHVRDLYLIKEPDPLLVVVDMLDAGETRDGQNAVLRYHMPPEATCALEGHELAVQIEGETFHVAAVTADAPLSRLVSGEIGENGEMQGWVSPETNVAVRSPTWELSSHAGGFSYFVTVASLQPGAAVHVQERESMSLDVQASRSRYRVAVASSSLTSHIEPQTVTSSSTTQSPQATYA
ncbi:MAG: alginate lyase family protein, partial [Pseudomonadota bacterium]